MPKTEARAGRRQSARQELLAAPLWSSWRRRKQEQEQEEDHHHARAWERLLQPAIRNHNSVQTIGQRNDRPRGLALQVDHEYCRTFSVLNKNVESPSEGTAVVQRGGSLKPHSALAVAQSGGTDA
jgi:hypothetical protein